MNVLLGLLAFDIAFAWASVTALPGAMALVYNGVARPTAEWCEALGIPVLMGFESSTTRAYAGGDAGEADAAFSCSSFDAVGYPTNCGSWFCAADTPSVPDWALANIEEYAYRYALRMIAAGRLGPLLAYGAPAAVDAAVRGIERAGLVGLRWKVGTWGMGEGGGPNQPPAQADAELVQSGNTPQYAGVADFNWLYALTAVFMAWFGPNPTPTPALLEESDMLVVHGPQQTLAGNRRAIAFLGSAPLQSWYGPSALGKVQAASDWVAAQAGEKIKEYVINSDDPADPVFSALVKLADSTPPPDGDDDGQQTPPLDLTPVRAAVTALEQALAAVGA